MGVTTVMWVHIVAQISDVEHKEQSARGQYVDTLVKLAIMLCFLNAKTMTNADRQLKPLTRVG